MDAHSKKTQTAVAIAAVFWVQIERERLLKEKMENDKKFYVPLHFWFNRPETHRSGWDRDGNYYPPWPMGPPPPMPVGLSFADEDSDDDDDWKFDLPKKPFQNRDGPPRKSSRVQKRNERCLCGSGKKFKACCAK